MRWVNRKGNAREFFVIGEGIVWRMTKMDALSNEKEEYANSW